MPLRVGFVVPHIFMHDAVLPHVLFSPGTLAIDLVAGLDAQGAEVTLFSPGPVSVPANNITADLTLFERELAIRGDTYVDLLKKHPFTFVTLARQVQSELIAKAFDMANRDLLDIVHIYTNEEDIALPFAQLCRKPVVFTHHDPFNFSVKYKNIFPKYAHLNWLSMSYAQRAGMPDKTHWIANIYHGLDGTQYVPNYTPDNPYLVYMGRIITPKGLHLAIDAVKQFNRTHSTRYSLKIAGKHYAGAKDSYWQERILPEINSNDIEYLGYIKGTADKSALLGGAAALIIPSTFEEPFGMVMIEALACGTPIVGLNSGAIPEIIVDGKTGYVVDKIMTAKVTKNGHNTTVVDETATSNALAQALEKVTKIERHDCRADFEQRFTLQRMAEEHIAAYETLVN